ncbi:MAG: FkbM family methyltransferase [Gammaproteobacteria bacterium]
MMQSLQLMRRVSTALLGLPAGGRIGEFLRKRYAHLDQEILLQDFDKDSKLYVNLSDHIGSQIFWYGRYSADVLSLADRLLQPADVVLDVGANLGEFSVFAAKRVPDGVVHAFEPTQKLYSLARRNIEVNGFSNTHVHEIGLSDHPGSFPIYKAAVRGADGSMNNGLNSLFGGNGLDVSETIEIVRLDDWCDEHRVSILDLIKMDIEGAELSALKGSEKILRRLKPKMIVEVNNATCDRAGYTPRDLVDYIVGLGYDISNIDHRGQTDIARDLNVVSRNVLCIPR